MSYYGFVVTDKGRALIAKLVAGKQLSLSRIMVGSGACPSNVEPRSLTDLVEPVAAATSTIPIYDGASVQMIIEYRSDLNGGLERGFWLREFGVYAFDPDDGEVLIYYGCLGDYPQWVSAASKNGVDVRRFPVAIVIGDDSGVEVDYCCEAWITAEDLEEYCRTQLLAQFLDELQRLIDEHNVSPEAHPDIRRELTGLDARIALLELMLMTSVTGNPFLVTFEDLDDVYLKGTWNESGASVDF